MKRIGVTVSDAMAHYLEEAARDDGEIQNGVPCVQPFIRRSLAKQLGYRGVKAGLLGMSDEEFMLTRRRES
jgi:hypothetical protein